MTACTSPAPAGPEGSLELRRRLLAAPARIELDPALDGDPLKGLARAGIGPDQRPGALAGSLLASLAPRLKDGRMDVLRAALVRGEGAFVVPELAIEAGDVLAFYEGSVATSRPRNGRRPDPKLVVEVEAKDGASARWAIDVQPKATQRWREHRIELAAFAGSTVTLRIRLGGVWQTDEDHAFIGDPGLYRRATAAKKPNVVLIWLDKFRADALAAYGGDPVVTPALNELASRGVVFEKAYSTGNHTFNATMHALTGTIGGPSLAVARRDLALPTLPASFAKAGWYAVAMGTNVHVSNVPEMGDRQLDMGFDHVLTELHHHNPRFDHWHYETDLEPWIRHQRREPFFMNLHYQGAHERYADPPKDESDPLWQKLLARTGGDRKEARYLLKAHVADEVVGRTIALLREEKLLENTLVVVLADHGALLGPEHRYYQWGWFTMVHTLHPTAFYEGQVRVPLLFVHPSLAPGVRKAPVSLLDLAPSVLEFAGLPVPPAFDGRALTPQLRADVAAAPRRLLLACEAETLFGALDGVEKLQFPLTPAERWPIAKTFVPKDDDRDWVSTDDRALFEAQLETRRKAGIPIGEREVVTTELHDVSADPGEQENLATARPDRAAELKAWTLARVFAHGGPMSLDPARHVVAVSSPTPARFEVRLRATGPLVLEDRWGACAKLEMSHPEPHVVVFTCDAHGEPGGVTFFRRTDASITIEVLRDGVPVGPAELFAGAHGLPRREASLTFGADALAAIATGVPRIESREGGVFLFREGAGASSGSGVGSELKAIFQAWGYAH